MVSIIIPVYNTGKNLEKCFKSILFQTYKNWECIVVDDCSTDVQTIDIINKWRKKHSNFIFIDKTINEGVDRARFLGLSMGKGDYFFFVDSDDWLEQDALEIMVKKAEDIDADIVVGKMCKYYICGFSKKGVQAPTEWMERVIQHEELMDSYYLSFFGCNILPVNVWATLYRRKLIEEANITYCGLKFGEDLVFNMKVFPFVRKYFAMNRCVYHYRVGLPGSSDKYLDSWLENFRMLYTVKMQALEKYGNERALFFQKVELVNYLKTYVNGCIKYRPKKRKENVNRLYNELSEPMYRNIMELKISPFKDKDVVDMIAKGDAEGFYNLIEQRYKKRPFKFRVWDKLAGIAKLFL